MKVPLHYQDLRFEIPDYSFHRGLFDNVLRNLHVVQNYRMKKMPYNTGGSMAQQIIWEPGDVSSDKRVRASDQDGRLTSHTHISVRLAAIAKVMNYRSLRPTRNINPWACYDYSHYRQVPSTRKNNRNTVIQRGLEPLFRDRWFKSQYCFRRNGVSEHKLTKLCLT